MNRKQRRAADAKRRKNDSQQAMEDKLMMFGHLPESCSACGAPFDKTSREMVFSWKVVVREEKESVTLFCPDCIKKTQEVLDGTTKNQ
tara:strand:- start:85 stop:348 length:264 start_codon:yes stop_codon:yes gene_type:complete